MNIDQLVVDYLSDHGTGRTEVTGIKNMGDWLKVKYRTEHGYGGSTIKLFDLFTFMHERTTKRDEKLLKHIDNLHGCISTLLDVLSHQVPGMENTLEGIEQFKCDLYNEIEGHVKPPAPSDQPSS